MKWFNIHPQRSILRTACLTLLLLTCSAVSSHIAHALPTSNAPTESPPTYTIAGHIEIGTMPIEGVTIVADATHSTVTDANGDYVLAGLPAGTYTITPTKEDDEYAIFYFIPASRTVSVPPDATAQDFNATGVGRNYMLSGRVTTANNIPIADVQIMAAQADAPSSNVLAATTASDGTYSNMSFNPGSYILTPSRPGFTFTPPRQLITLTLASPSAVANFVGQGLLPVYLPLVETPCVTAFCGAVAVQSGGVCCVGGPPGSTRLVAVQFTAAGWAGAITGMRVDNGACNSVAPLDEAAWQPYTPRLEFPVTFGSNWSTFSVRAQYRDVAGNLSPIYCDSVALEGFEPPHSTTDDTMTRKF